ncbi:anti-sigma factor [Agromyces soli]
MNHADEPSGPPKDELRELASAYALGALDEADRVRFEQALATSPELQADVDAFRAAALPLADAAEPVAPPQHLKSALFARLDEVEQERPSDAAAAPAAPIARVVPAPAPAIAPAPAVAPAPAPSEPHEPVDELAARRARRRLALLLSSAAAVVVLVVGLVVATNWPGPNGWGAQRQMAAIAAAPDAERSSTEVAGGGTVTLVWSAEQGASAIIAEALPALGDDQTYELWYIDESGAAAAGTFDTGGTETWRVLEGEFVPGTAVGITVEPAGGSEQPTTDPIAVIAT